ncbi:hypothetical protein PHSC3_001193 [Chlamydiales bacterium STE3]|nr:hypothetical protein PHSC3_001193 [Chlamydiales bacterium STE3]
MKRLSRTGFLPITPVELVDLQPSSEAILMMLILREVYNRSLRNLQGFVQSLLHAMGLNLPLPSYSQISRRAKSLHKRVNRLTQGKKSCHIIFDSTRLKVHGEGEWKVKIHGRGRPRKWVKVHIAVDPKTQEIVAEVVTSNDCGEAALTSKLLEKSGTNVKRVIAEGAYERKIAREAIKNKNAKALMPPQKMQNFAMTEEKEMRQCY